MAMLRERFGRTLSDRAIAGALAVITAAFVLYKLMAQIKAGPYWDSFAFLANAAELAGRSIGYTEPARPPLLSVLTAPFLAAGPMSEAALQSVEAALSFAGVMGLFFLLRRRVTALPAALGALGLLASPPVWTWLGVGYTDIPAISLCIWSLLLVIKATEEQRAWYLLALPMAVLATLMRVTNLLFLPAFCIWLVMRWRPLRDADAILAGTALAALTYSPFGSFYARRFDDLFYPFTVTREILDTQLAAGTTATAEPGAFPGPLVIVLTIVAISAVAGLLSSVDRELWDRARSSWARALIMALFVGAAVVAQLVAGLAVRQATLAAAVLVVALTLAPREERKRARGPVIPAVALDATMALWGLAFLDHWMHSTIHVPRYLIPMLPAAIYFLVLGLHRQARWLERNVVRQWSSEELLPSYRSLLAAWFGVALVLAGLLASNLASPAAQMPGLKAIERAADWLGPRLAEDPSAVVYSDWWAVTSWYLGRQTRAMPTYTDVRNNVHELEKSRAKYFVTWRSELEGASFTPAFTAGDGVHVLARGDQPAQLPRVAYVGDAWQNYLERICDFSFFLDYDLGVQGWDRSAFLDRVGPEQFEHADAVALYAFRWRSRAQGERAFERYLDDGGTVVIDASANFRDPAYMLDDAALFETAIERQTWPAKATVTVDERLRLRHSSVPASFEIEFSRDGEPWIGAGYTPLSTAGDWKVLASANGRPLVVEQRVRNGRVFWLAANLVWHAKESGSSAEAELIEAVFEEATSSHGVVASVAPVPQAQ